MEVADRLFTRGILLRDGRHFSSHYCRRFRLPTSKLCPTNIFSC